MKHNQASLPRKPSTPSSASILATVSLPSACSIPRASCTSKPGVIPRARASPALREPAACPHRARSAARVPDQCSWRYGHEVIVANPDNWPDQQEHPQDRSRRRRNTGPPGPRRPALAPPVYHRSAETQAHLAILRARDTVVHARTMLVNCARGLAKQLGHRLPACASTTFPSAPRCPPSWPMPSKVCSNKLTSSETIRTTTRAWNGSRASIRRTRPAAHFGAWCGHAHRAGLHPHSRRGPGALRQEPRRGPYLGLNPKRRQSGEQDPQLGITKLGNCCCAVCWCSAPIIARPLRPGLGPAPVGPAMAARGGTRPQRAVVAVARKLAVLLHHLWVSGEDFEPFRPRRHPAPEPAR